MFKYKKIATLFLIVFFSQLTTAETASVTGKITNIYTYNTGTVLIQGFRFEGAGCRNNSGFIIPASHPRIDQYLSILLTAKAMQLDVTVKAKVDDCWYPEITESDEETTHFRIH